MRKTWYGREWINQDVLKKFSNNMGLLLEYQLAFENFCLIKGVEDNGVKQTMQSLSNIRNSSKNLHNEEDEIAIYEKTNELIKQCSLVVDNIGRDKFLFYEDGTIEYKVGD